MGHVPTHGIITTLFLQCTPKSEARQAKMACKVPQEFLFINIQACMQRSIFLSLGIIFLSELVLAYFMKILRGICMEKILENHFWGTIFRVFKLFRYYHISCSCDALQIGSMKILHADRVRIKYYKVIRDNCKACRGAPTMVQCDLPRF